MRQTKEQVKETARLKAMENKRKKHLPVWEKIKIYVKEQGFNNREKFYSDVFQYDLQLRNSHTGSIAIRWAVSEELCIAVKTSDKNKDSYWVFEEVE